MTEAIEYAILFGGSFGLSLTLSMWLHRRERYASREAKLKWFEAGVRSGIAKEKLDAEERRVDAEIEAIRRRESIKGVGA